MAKYSIEDSTLTGIADAIREKEGTTDSIPVADMAARIAAIEAGGGGAKLLFGTAPTFVSGNMSHGLMIGTVLSATLTLQYLPLVILLGTPNRMVMPQNLEGFYNPTVVYSIDHNDAGSFFYGGEYECAWGTSRDHTAISEVVARGGKYMTDENGNFTVTIPVYCSYADELTEGGTINYVGIGEFKWPT